MWTTTVHIRCAAYVVWYLLLFCVHVREHGYSLIWYSSVFFFVRFVLVLFCFHKMLNLYVFFLFSSLFSFILSFLFAYFPCTLYWAWYTANSLWAGLTVSIFPHELYCMYNFFCTIQLVRLFCYYFLLYSFNSILC